MNREEATAFADAWAAAWNGRDIEHVLVHFDEQVAFTSPTALAVVGAATVRGKQALRAYWTAALQKITSLRFTVDRVVWDPASQELAIIYVAEINGNARRTSENLRFGANGLVVTAEVFHGVAGDTAHSRG